MPALTKAGRQRAGETAAQAIGTLPVGLSYLSFNPGTANRMVPEAIVRLKRVSSQDWSHWQVEIICATLSGIWPQWMGGEVAS